MQALRFHDGARRPSYCGASSRGAVAKRQEIGHRARTTFAALASPAAARRWRVLEAEHARVRSAPQEVLGRARTSAARAERREIHDDALRRELSVVVEAVERHVGK